MTTPAADVHVCPPDHAHGQKRTCYTDHRCRCGDCRAGTAAYQRVLRGSQPRPPAQPCGTPAAYQRHLRVGEPPCTPCLHAHTARRRELRAAAATERATAGAPEGVTYTLHVDAADVPVVAAAILDRALAIENSHGTRPGDPDKAARLRAIHKTLATWHRNHTKEQTP